MRRTALGFGLSLALYGSGGVSYSPASLFAASEQGIWLDPSDIETYTAPKGSELIALQVDRDFSGPVVGWVAYGAGDSFGSVGGQLTGADDCRYGITGLTIGKWYEVDWDHVSGSGINLYVDAPCVSSAYGVNLTNGKFAYQSTSTELGIYKNAGAVIDNISVKELTAIATATMFQDSAGYTPVTAVEQPVGLIFDKRTGLGYEPIGTTGWIKTTGDGVVTVVGNQVTITGATTTTRIDPPTARALVPGMTRVRINVTSFAATGGLVWAAGSPVGFGAVGSFTSITPSTNSNTDRVQIDTGSVTFTIEDYAQYKGNHASQATTAQKPLLKIDGNGKYYLAFDGVDDGLATGSIVWTGNHLLAIQGFRPAVVNLTQMLWEIGPNALATAGSANVIVENDARLWWYRFGATGANVRTSALLAASSVNVSTKTIDFAGATSATEVPNFRLNGADAARLFTGDDTGGTGFATHALNIGQRAVGSFRFNGNLYQLIIRNAATDAAGITAAEAFTNTKTGAY